MIGCPGVKRELARTTTPPVLKCNRIIAPSGFILGQGSRARAQSCVQVSGKRASRRGLELALQAGHEVIDRPQIWDLVRVDFHTEMVLDMNDDRDKV
jgi:hypothetical protein